MIKVEGLRNSKVVLREMTRADVDAMACWPRFAEPDLQWANLELLTPREREAYFERGRSNSTRKRFVVVSPDGQIIGTVGLRNIDFFAEEATLGIIIRADEVGNGYGTDAIRSVLDYAFRTLGLRRVRLDVAENNLRARRCYESVGFSEISRHVGLGSVVYIDMIIYKHAFLYQEQIR
jgi:RimJ/RimL family protein N-acetyltransferase